MFKRLTALHLCVCLLFLTLLGRIGFLATDEAYSASTVNNSVSLTISQQRGLIYDRNMQPLVNQEKNYVAIIRPVEKVITSLDQMFTKEEIDNIMKRLQEGKPILQKVKPGTQGTAEIPVVTTYSRYTDDQILAHIIGNYAASEETRFGLEQSFYDFLDTDSFIKIKYHVDARGNMLQGDMGEIITNHYDSQSGVQLTIDKRLQQICEEAADNAESFQKGSIVVLDVETSQILAMVSRPNLNLNDLASSMENADAPFINRSLTAYTVGSVFKLAVACVALEYGYDDFSYNCTGSIQIGDTVFGCHEHEGHGWMNMSNAIGQSCNPYFIALGQELGGTLLLNEITKFGFGEATQLAEGLNGEAGTLPTMNAIQQKGNLANFSFGQGDLMATPLQIANLVACIANDGIYHTPSLVTGLINEDGSLLENQVASKGSQAVSVQTARSVQAYMIETVASGSGRRATPEQGGAGGKTATAETGWVAKDGTDIFHVWFAGFYPANAPSYAIVVMNEDGQSGATDCGPIFKQIADAINSQSLT